MDIPCGVIPTVSTCIATSRLLAEARQLKEYPVDGCEAFPQDDNVLKWVSVVKGPKGSFYENGVFFCEIIFNRDYPYSPPDISFLTRIYHQSIDEKGHVDLPLLDHWKPCLGVADVLEALRFLLRKKPQQFEEELEFEFTAREWTNRYAV
ncbi:unnamed protein product [Bursaphelenchus xylophilus]|uniref:(pine wood nematode) hypothetical protein n=1 Tax=Bursaphelenchus xylophilus TaxID=6326 RepID=A0A1I7SAG3_BURXY|nr:unnamed protein product [Bursaphelenchus xylophilus]CAG9083927.1 unnamed protein product [Bursaphelenchus xylophilus]